LSLQVDCTPKPQSIFLWILIARRLLREVYDGAISVQAISPPTPPQAPPPIVDSGADTAAREADATRSTTAGGPAVTADSDLDSDITAQVKT
jgi:hypothetical protein